MTWNPRLEYALRVVLSPTGRWSVLVRSYENKGNRKRGSTSYDAVQDLEREMWVTVATLDTLFEATVHCYALCVNDSNAIREIDLGGLDPAGPEVAFIKSQFELLTI